MADSRDFLPLLNHDMSLKIFSYLGSADVVRASAVSHSWRAFVIANGVSKSLCLRRYPETSCAIKAIEEENIIEPLEVETNGNVEMEKLKKNHRVYAFLARGGESYWSSERESNPDLPETLTYKLVPKLCFITKIRVQLFQASAKAVRFRMGHFRTPERETDLVGDYEAHPRSIEDHEVWTYTSQKFPMLQETCLQMFSLPKPVFAIGGLLQIELLDRVPGPLHVRVSQVEVVGRQLTGDFIVEPIGCSGEYALKHIPGTECTRYYQCGDCGRCCQ
ncbi:F-box protein At4g00755-like [Papaver somniferum]|nr:F-box protein At4g00755-like [Papaver somniferum]